MSALRVGNNAVQYTHRHDALKLRLMAKRHIIAQAIEDYDRDRTELLELIRLDVANEMINAPCDGIADEVLEPWAKLWRAAEARRMHERALGL